MSTTGTKEKRREWYKEWYANPENRAQQKKNSARNKIVAIDRNRDFVINYKATHPCIKCGENRYYCLDFHHVSDKDKEIARGIMVGWSIERIKKEISKCVVLCRNCHAELHHNSRMGC